MPQYTYRCLDCTKEHEKIQTIAEGEEYLNTFKCPECGHDHGQRIMGKTSFTLRGNGWFADGYQ